MKQFFNDYFNIKKMIQSKKEYREHMNRVNALPTDYQYVYKKIQEYMWRFVAGAGYDMMQLQMDLLELFEHCASEDKSVLEVTGEDIVSFAEELLKNTRTYTEDWKVKLNNEIKENLNSIYNK